MEKKKKLSNVLTVAITILLLGVGVTFGYYISEIFFGGEGSAVVATTLELGDITLTTTEEIPFTDSNMYPGHVMLSAIKVTASNASRLAVFDVVFEGYNEFDTELEYKIYKYIPKDGSKPNPSVYCELKPTYKNGYTLYADECTKNGFELLGDPIHEGYISKVGSDTQDEVVTLAPNETIVSDSNGSIVFYYYLVIEYPNHNWYQNEEQGRKIKGALKLTNASATPDMSVLAIYKDTGNTDENGIVYEKTDVIPSDMVLNQELNYNFNDKKSSCTNGASVKWDSIARTLTTSGLTGAGTSCSLYFDMPACAKDGTACKKILENKTLASREETLQGYATPLGTATKTSGIIYRAAENGGITFYFAGNVADNYVFFANYYWRIVRVNENGSIRLIYQGPAATSTLDATNTEYSVYNDSSETEQYFGFTYFNDQGVETDSVIKSKLDNWFKQNLLSSEQFLDGDAGFCNDRSKGQNGIYNVNNRTFKTSGGISAELPTFNCIDTNNDLYTLKCDSNDKSCNTYRRGTKSLNYPIGLITADEVNFAGGIYNTQNKNYYLYTGRNYWTMSPRAFGTMSNSNGKKVAIHNIVMSSGLMASVVTDTSKASYNANCASSACYYTNNDVGIRPVINLRADVKLSGSGTTTAPYTVGL